VGEYGNIYFILEPEVLLQHPESPDSDRSPSVE